MPNSAPAMIHSAVAKMTGKQQAIYLKSLYPDLNDKQIAECCGVDPSTLSRSLHFQRLKELEKRPSMPRGWVDNEGNIEAWDESRP
jgi:DNA-directed RNA polymerase specialized sigma subunit